MVAQKKICAMILFLFIGPLNGMDHEIGATFDEVRSFRLISDSVRVPLMSESLMCLGALDFRWSHKAARHGILTRSLIKKDFDELKDHIKNGASVNEYDERGVSLAWRTIDMRNRIGEKVMIELVELYSRNGLDVHHKVGFSQHNLVHNLSTKQIPSLLKVVILAGADVNAKDSEGNTPLHCAVKDKQIVELLLSYNAHYDVKNNEGLTPYDVAQDFEVKEMLKDEESVNKAIALYAQTDVD